MPDTAEPLEIAICPGCCAQNVPFAVFCFECGAPIGATATLAPFETIHARGWVYRRAIAKPGWLALIGIWLIFAPAAALTVIVFVHEARNGLRFGLVVLALIFGIAVSGVYQVTRNFAARRLRRP